MRTRDVGRRTERTKLPFEAVAVADDGVHAAQRGDAAAKDETAVEDLQERVRAVEPPAVPSASPNDVSEDPAEQAHSLDSVLPSPRLWSLHRTDLLQLRQRREANVRSPQVLHGRDLLRRVHSSHGAHSIV